jgi:crotonobetainyl-CoA:carnitine CoA-transferase CaiB-like acyl-CoA transferase
VTDARDLRVVDFSTHWSGPMASHILAELGADVIKVENPSIGDGNRGLSPYIEGVGMVHVALNSGTRSLAFDRRDPRWPDVVAALARWADVVLVGAKPVDAAKRGIDFATMAKANPRIVYCLISGFGVVGPWQDYSAHGQNIDALGGLVTAEWVDGLPRTPSGWRSSGTTLAGMWAAIGVLDAVVKVRSGTVSHAQHVDISIWGSAMAWQWRDLTTHAALGHPWDDYSELGSRYAMYPTADGRALLVAPVERKFWERWCDVIGYPTRRDVGDWSASGMEFGRGADFQQERLEIAELTRTRTLDEWVAALEPTKIPFAPLLTSAEAMDSEHGRANAVMSDTEVDGKPVRLTAVPVRVTDGGDAADPQPRPVRRLSPPPTIGQHNRDVLAAIGLSELALETGSTV